MTLRTCFNVHGQSKEWKYFKSFMWTFVNSPFIAWSQKACFVLVRIDGKHVCQGDGGDSHRPQHKWCLLCYWYHQLEKGWGRWEIRDTHQLIKFPTLGEKCFDKNLLALTFDKPSCLSHQIWFLSNIFFFFNMVAKILTVCSTFKRCYLFIHGLIPGFQKVGLDFPKSLLVPDNNEISSNGLGTLLLLLL